MMLRFYAILCLSGRLWRSVIGLFQVTLTAARGDTGA